MPTEVTVVGPCTRQLNITIPKDQVKQVTQAVWRDAQRSVSIKGFRPGKAPRAMIERMYGESIREDARMKLVNAAFYEAIQEHDIHPLETPRVDPEAIDLDAEQDISFEVTIDVRPEFEVTDYKGLEVGAPNVSVSADDIDQQIEALRNRAAEVKPVEEGVVGKGDFLTADVSYRVDGAIVVHHEDKLIDTQRDSIDGLDAQGGTANFLGQRKGNTVTVNVKLPDDFEPSGFAGADAQLLCTVKELRRVTLPEVDDAFAVRVGADSVEDLRAKMATEYERYLERQRNKYIEESALDALIKKTSFDLPDRLLQRATEESVKNMAHHLTHQGMPEAEAQAKAAAESERLGQEQERGLRVTFLVDKIAGNENISVSDKEVEDAVRSLAASQNMNPQDAYDQLDEAGRLGSIRAEILEAKVRKLLRDEAKVFEAQPSESASEAES